MAGLAQRFKDWRGPSRRDLQAQIANLEDNQRKFGKSGTAVASGVELTYGKFDYDPNTALQGAGKHEIYERMESDPHIKGLLLDKSLPLLTAEWEVKPASDKPKDVEVAEFCAANLLRQPSDKYGHEYWLQTSWKAQRLVEIMSMLTDGFAMFVSSWKRVGSQVVYDRLQWIEPETIDGTQPWEIDDQDNIIAINRKLNTPTDQFLYDERITADRLKLYVWNLKGARFEGKSFIRAMYGAWLRKEFILRQSAIAAQKFGAPAPIGHYPESWTPTDINRYKQVVMGSRGESPAELFGMFPMTADGQKSELTFAGSEVQQVDRLRGLVDGENKEIHQGGRDSSAMLGETGGGGSRALGESKGKGEIKLTQAIAAMVGEWENHGVANLKGVVEELVDRNFSVSAYPELVCSKIDPYEDFSETLEAWKAGIIPKTPDARRQVCEGTLGLNLPDEAYEVQEPPPLPMVPPTPGKEIEEADKAENEEEAEQVAAAAKDDFTQRIAHLLAPSKEGAPTKGGRFPDKAGSPTARHSTHRQVIPRGRARHHDQPTRG